MKSLFSSQFRAELSAAIEHRKSHSTLESVTRLKRLVREAVRAIEADPATGRKLRNRSDFPGCRLYASGAWVFIYRHREDGVTEFVAMRHVGL